MANVKNKSGCPRWMQFLEDIFPEAPEKQKTLQAFLGQALMPDLQVQNSSEENGGVPA